MLDSLPPNHHCPRIAPLLSSTSEILSSPTPVTEPPRHEDDGPKSTGTASERGDMISGHGPLGGFRMCCMTGNHKSAGALSGQVPSSRCGEWRTCPLHIFLDPGRRFVCALHRHAFRRPASCEVPSHDHGKRWSCYWLYSFTPHDTLGVGQCEMDEGRPNLTAQGGPSGSGRPRPLRRGLLLHPRRHSWLCRRRFSASQHRPLFPPNLQSTLLSSRFQ